MFPESLKERARWIANRGMSEGMIPQSPAQPENPPAPDETQQGLPPEQIVLLGLALVCNVDQLQQTGQTFTRIGKQADLNHQ